MPVLRRKLGDVPECFRLSLGWTIPLVAVLASGLLLIQVSVISYVVTALFPLAGALLYRAVRSRNP